MAIRQGRAGIDRRLAVGLSRRGMLNGGLVLGAAALAPRFALAQAAGAHVHMPELGVATSPVVPAMDQPLVEPEVRRSANGVLSTSLRCAFAYRDIGGMRLYLRSYEGGLAPTLRMKPGETLKIRLINDLPPNRDLSPANPSFPHQNNNTNFHFHGAHCSPSGIADNVMRSMLPGKSYDIEIALPADHTQRHLLVPSASPRLGRRAGGERHGGRHRRRRRLRRRPRDRPGTRAGHAPGGGRVRCLLHGRGVRHALSGNRDALPDDQRPAPANHRHAAGRGAALAPGRLAVPEQHAAGTRQASTGRHRLRRNPARVIAGDEAAADGAGTARRRAGAGGRSGHVRVERHAVRPGPRLRPLDRWRASSWRATRCR